jgi:hypothetical protein
MEKEVTETGGLDVVVGEHAPVHFMKACSREPTQRTFSTFFKDNGPMRIVFGVLVSLFLPVIVVLRG